MAQYTPSAVKPPSGALADDGDFETTRPRICVDYLSHQWQEEDVWRSWRSMTRFKYQIANGMRLENASWRTWWKKRNNLPTVSPETLNWLKDSDVTWLYGPLHQAPIDPPTKISSVQDKFGIDAPKALRRKQAESPPPDQVSSFQAKPILKRRSVTDILAMAVVPPRNPHSQNSPIYESVSAELKANEEEGDDLVMESELTLSVGAGVLQAPSRPLWHTKSDSIVVRQRKGASLSTSPMSIHSLTPPGENAVVELAKSSSLSPPEYGRARNSHRSDSSSSYQVSVSDDSATGRVKPKRHISFNSFVEQRIVVDPVVRLSTVYARSSSDSCSDEEGDEDTILQMRSSSGSSISSGRSGRRGSSNSGTSLPDTQMNAKVTPQMTMITAPIAPTLLKEPDHLPAPSPAVVFVAPQGVDEETLKYEVHIASRPQFAVQADRRRAGSMDWSPNGGSDRYEQGEMTDYFANVPLSQPVDPDREPIYTDEDDDAITVRRRMGGRSPRSNDAGTREGSSPTEAASQPLPRKSSFARKSHQGGASSPPTVSHQEVARSMARYGVNIRDAGGSKPLGVPRRAGSSSDLMEPPRWSSPKSGGLVGSAPRSSHLSASMSSMRSGAGGRSGIRNRPRGASFEGVDLGGHTSALSARSGPSAASGTDDELATSQTAALFSPPRDSDLADTRGRSQRISEEVERPRRGRSLLRTGSSSTISERERSSTTGSSASPIGSLSPRSNSVGIVGGYIVPPTGIGAIMVTPSSSLRGSGLRFESGLWTTGEERRIDGGDLAQVEAPHPNPRSSGGLVRTSSSGDIRSQTGLQSSTHSSGIRRTNSSTAIATNPIMLQRTNSSSNIAVTARQSPQLVTSPMNDTPTLTLQPSSRRTSFSEMGRAAEFIPHEDGLASNTSLASHSLESTGSFWRASELESPATPLSPASSPLVSTTNNSDETSLHRDLLSKASIKPRASGLSLASSASGGSNSSNGTVVPTQAVNVKRRSAQLASVSSSVSSNASTPPGHRHSGSKSSLSTAAPPTPPSAMRSNSSSSVATRSVSQTVATRSEVDSPTAASEKHLRRLSGGISSPTEERVSSTYPSSPVSPGFVLSNVVGSAKGLFGAIWGSDHSG